MDFDISRDFLDGISLRHPASADGKHELKANGGLHFLPSSPDGTMHTAVVSFSLSLDNDERPFAQGAWRFLFTTSQHYAPKEDKESAFHRSLLVAGAGKVIAVLNNSCMLANMPLIPIDPQRLVQGSQGSQGSAQAKAPSAGGSATPG